MPEYKAAQTQTAEESADEVGQALPWRLRETRGLLWP